MDKLLPELPHRALELGGISQGYENHIWQMIRAGLEYLDNRVEEFEESGFLYAHPNAKDIRVHMYEATGKEASGAQMDSAFAVVAGAHKHDGFDKFMEREVSPQVEDPDRFFTYDGTEASCPKGSLDELEATND